MRVLIAVTHLLGAGHLTRAAALARAFAGAGHAVTLVSGGLPAPLVRLDGVRLVQLPPLQVAGIDFSHLLGPDGRPADAALRARRRGLLLDLLAESAPDAVLTELFPFGRRVLADEFLALVEAARARRPRPLVLASVRDILVAPDRPEKVFEAHARVAALYDAVLVHGDPALLPLDASWPLDDATRGTIRYTGYVDEGGPEEGAGARQGIVVAAGSGTAGLDLFRAATAAAARRPDLGWRILVGHGVPEAAFLALGRGLPDGTVTRARPDYRALLAAAAVSVSQCGYNTAVDLLANGTPAVLVPFEGGRETEQRLRAERLAARGLARVLPEVELTADTLLAAACAVLEGRAGIPSPLRGGAGVRVVQDGSLRCLSHRPNPQPLPAWMGNTPGPGSSLPSLHGIDLGGAARSVAIVEELLSVRSRSRGSLHGPSAHRPTPDPSGLDRLRAALDRAAEDGIRVPVWWRDDDAVVATPALDRLLATAEAHAAPLLLAAIPAGVEPSLGRCLAGTDGVHVAVHGLAHRNHAPPGERPAEFGPHRPLAALLADAEAGLRLARERLPAERLLPVFVPPWNRCAPDLATALPGLGFRGFSAAGGPAVAGLARADADLDPIDWRGTRSLRDPAALLDDLSERIERDPRRPIGLLTHHLAHDAAIWDFLDGLLPVLLRHPAVTLPDPRSLFCMAVDAGATPPSSKYSARARTG